MHDILLAWARTVLGLALAAHGAREAGHLRPQQVR